MAWFFLYFFHDEPMVDDKVVAVVLAVATVVGLVLTGVGFWAFVIIYFENALMIYFKVYC